MDVFLRGFQVALLEVDPAEGVPVCGEAGYMSQVLRAKAFQRGVAQLGGGFSHGGFRVLLGAFQVHILERQLIGHVVPHRRRWRQLDGLVKLLDRKSTRLNSSHGYISYAVFCLKKKNESPGGRYGDRHVERLESVFSGE